MKKKENNIIILFKEMLRYCKNDLFSNELLFNRMINVPNLITNNKKFPLYGFHSTIYEVLDNIYKDGFVPLDRIGTNKHDPEVAIFSIPFKINYEEVVSESELSPNDTISISNGISRTIREENEVKADNPQYIVDEKYLKFPIILACFTDSKSITINEWIKCTDNKDIHIVGHFNIKIEKNKFYTNYRELERLRKENEVWYSYLNLNYIIDGFVTNPKFVERNTIPIAIKESTYKGGKNNRKIIKKTRKIRKSKNKRF
jgi:hypothetical protein